MFGFETPPGLIEALFAALGPLAVFVAPTKGVLAAVAAAQSAREADGEGPAQD